MKLFGINNKEYSAKDILKQPDKCAKDYTFPMLDNGYIYPVSSKLTAYRDKKRWALIIEVIGFNYRGGGHNGISNCLNIFGNCIHTKPGTDNANFLGITNDSSGSPTFDEEYQESLNPKAKTMMLRDKKVDIIRDREFYFNKGIELKEVNKIFVWEFLRSLVPKHAKTLVASEKEIRERIPADLPKIMELIEWNHPDCAGLELPSHNETFIQIAKVLESGEINFYKPKKQPNNHWKNWPEGGTL